MVRIEFTPDRPLYKQIRDYLKQQILSGQMRGGERLPSDYELSKALGVAVGTIKEAYADLIREGYLTRRPGRGTSVAMDVPALKSFSANADVGVVFHDVFSVLDDGYLAKILEGANLVADELGYTLNIFATKGRGIFRGNELLSEAITRRNIAGILALSLMEESDLRSLQEIQCPFVVTDNEYINLDVPTVLIDDYQAAYMATQELISRRHRKIALATSRWAPADPRVYMRPEKMARGYETALGEAGIAYSKALIKDRKSGVNGVEDLIAETGSDLEEITGLVVDGDWVARQLCAYLEKSGRVIGKDVDLVVYSDNINVERALTIYKPLREMGQLAMRKLANQMVGLSFTRKDVLPVKAAGEQ